MRRCSAGRRGDLGRSALRLELLFRAHLHIPGTGTPSVVEIIGDTRGRPLQRDRTPHGIQNRVIVVAQGIPNQKNQPCTSAYKCKYTARSKVDKPVVRFGRIDFYGTTNRGNPKIPIYYVAKYAAALYPNSRRSILSTLPPPNKPTSQQAKQARTHTHTPIHRISTAHTPRYRNRDIE